MKKNIVISVVLLIMMLILTIVIIVLAVKEHSALNKCETNESPFCFMFMCKGTTKTCGKHAYRCLGNGKVMCSSAQDEVVDKVEGDDICT